MAAVASALAHLLAASGGEPVVVADRQAAPFFQPALDRLAGPGGRALVLAGPGLPEPDGDFALVPQHPQTGELWTVAPPAEAIPLAWDVWRHLAFHRPPKPVGRAVPTLPEALPTLLPGHRFEPDDRVLLSVLARRPEVRQPRLRAVYDVVSGGRHLGPAFLG